MKNVRYGGLLAMVLFLCGAEGDCDGEQKPTAPNDPSEGVLATGRNFDIQRTRGIVTALGVRYFAGDQKHTAEQKGQAYYFVQVQLDESIAPALPVAGAVPSPQSHLFVGIKKEVYDALEPNMRLPAYPLMVSERLPFLHGRVVDKVAYPRENEFFIVIDEGRVVKTYRVTVETYYRDVTVGMELPPVASPMSVSPDEMVRNR